MYDPKRRRRAGARVWARRFRRRPLLPFLIAATLAFDAVFAATLETLLTWSSNELSWRFALSGGYGAVIGQLHLIGVWIVCRRHERLAQLAIAFTLVSAILLGEQGEPGLGFRSFFPVYAIFIIVATTIGAAIVFGLIRRTSRRGLRCTRARPMRIASLLVWTTIAAAAAIAGRQIDWRVTYDIAVQSAAIPGLGSDTLVVVSSFTAALLTRRAWPVVLVGATVAVKAIAVRALFDGVTLASLAGFSLYSGTMVATVLVWLLALRSGRRPRATPATPELNLLNVDEPFAKPDRPEADRLTVVDDEPIDLPATLPMRLDVSG